MLSWHHVLSGACKIVGNQNGAPVASGLILGMQITAASVCDMIDMQGRDMMDREGRGGQGYDVAESIMHSFVPGSHTTYTCMWVGMGVSGGREYNSMACSSPQLATKVRP